MWFWQLSAAPKYECTEPVCVQESRVGRLGETADASPSVGVIAIVICITVAVLLADVSTARRWGVFSAGCVGGHPPLLVVPHAALKQA